MIYYFEMCNIKLLIRGSGTKQCNPRIVLGFRVPRAVLGKFAIRRIKIRPIPPYNSDEKRCVVKFALTLGLIISKKAAGS